MNSLIEEAEAFARKNHEGQVRKGEAQEPYITHVADVASRVKRYGGSEIAIIGAWLHDVVEDCDPEIEDIENMFGKEVASVVAEVTDNKSLTKENRKLLQVENASHKSESACLIKWADKTCNLISIAASPPPWPDERKQEYVDWAKAVTSQLPFSTPVAIREFDDAVELALSASTTKIVD